MNAPSNEGVFMSGAVASLVALLAAIVVSMVSRINVGLIGSGTALTQTRDAVLGAALDLRAGWSRRATAGVVGVTLAAAEY